MWKHEQPWAPDYVNYIENGIHDKHTILLADGLSDRIFSLIKSLDIHDNLVIEPKMPRDKTEAQKIANKEALYQASAAKIARESPHIGRNPGEARWMPRFFQIVESIRPEDIEEQMQALDAYMGIRLAV